MSVTMRESLHSTSHSSCKQSPLDYSHQADAVISKKVLVVEDDYSLREALEDTLSLASYDVVTAKSAEQAITILENNKEILMVVSDINMGELSGHDLLKHVTTYHAHIPVLLMTAYGSVRDSVDAIRHGAVDYLVKPFEPKELVDIVHRQLGSAMPSIEGLPIAEDESSLQLLALSQRVAQANSTALIIGESGTGKEVLARYIHQQSPRADQPFIAINCAAIPENMLEAMLFGYEKGAYTGAYNSAPGKFEQANGGTLLLDEISEMDIGLQAKLLRVLQEREVERLGGRKVIPLDVRVIATSNRDMVTCVAEGKFREDLYYRLSVLPLLCKPLRERKKDIIPLAQSLLNKHIAKQKRQNTTLDNLTKQALIEYAWPGNVRELDNVMQRALILQTGTIITEEDLALDMLSHKIKSVYPESSGNDNGEELMHHHQNIVTDSESEDSPAHLHAQKKTEELGDNLQKHEFDIIYKTLSEERGSRQNTAKRLGISPRTLRYKLAKMREVGFSF